MRFNGLTIIFPQTWKLVPVIEYLTKKGLIGSYTGKKDSFLTYENNTRWIYEQYEK